MVDYDYLRKKAEEMKRVQERRTNFGKTRNFLRKGVEIAKRHGRVYNLTPEWINFIGEDEGSAEKNVIWDLAMVNSSIKEGRSGKATEWLRDAYRDSRSLPKDKKDKYGEAIERRIERMSNKTLRDYRKGSFRPDDAYSAAMNIEEAVRIGKKIASERVGERNPTKGLETMSAAVAVLGIVGGIFFSSNLTGNAIGNLTNSSTNFIGAGLFVVGLIAGYFWMKRK